ncbi:hypothetical protein ACLOJK_022916 [Asimina triloba]
MVMPIEWCCDRWAITLIAGRDLAWDGRWGRLISPLDAAEDRPDLDNLLAPGWVLGIPFLLASSILRCGRPEVETIQGKTPDVARVEVAVCYRLWPVVGIAAVRDFEVKLPRSAVHRLDGLMMANDDRR